jgi:hypothetical protein
MSIYPETFSQYASGQYYNTKKLVESVKNIVKVVIDRHFNNYRYDEDIISIGTTKIFELLSSGYLDTSRNLVNVLYSGARNEICNYIKKEKRSYYFYPSFEDDYYCDDNYHISNTIEILDNIEKCLSDVSDNFSIVDIEINKSLDYYIKMLLGLTYYEKFALQVSLAKTIIRRE